MLHVTEAQYLGGYSIWLRFNNGAVGRVDLVNELTGEMFEPLRDIERFKSFRVDKEIETIVWENGADFAPEFLYQKMQQKAA